MRKIKFRAWDVLENKMEHGVSLLGEAIIFKHSYDEISEYLELDEYIEVADPDWWKVMQSTGLKDKNGVEIYEGDIIGADLGDEYFYAIVKHGGWCWYGDMIFANDIIDFDDIGDENDMSADCDVLGNIYENPKLLEEIK